MSPSGRDPYQVLGVSRGASDDVLHTAYRRLVQLHHPDHNAGSADSARRFEEVQEAYAQIRQARAGTARADERADEARSGPSDRDHASRLADLEREIRARHLAHERARQDAREAAADGAKRPSDEELGYVTTDDSFSKILADARAELSDRFADAREHPAAGRVADLLDELAAKLTGESPPRADK